MSVAAEDAMLVYGLKRKAVRSMPVVVATSIRKSVPVEGSESPVIVEVACACVCS